MGVARRNVAVLDEPEEDEAAAPRPVRATSPDNSAPDLDDDGLDAEDEDEHTGRSTAILTGKAGVKATKEKSSAYANEFKFEPGHKHLIRFLEEESFASYRQHWVEKQGQKSYICIGKGCPLCAAGDTPSGKYAYNIWDFDRADVKALIIGPVLQEQMETEVEASKNQELAGNYWSVSRSGKGRKTTYKFDEVKIRDLEEDFGITPADAASQYADPVLYKASIFKVPKVAVLAKVARTFTEDDVDDDDD